MLTFFKYLVLGIYSLAKKFEIAIFKHQKKYLV
jgi:hypothetical protein